LVGRRDRVRLQIIEEQADVRVLVETAPADRAAVPDGVQVGGLACVRLNLDVVPAAIFEVDRMERLMQIAHEVNDELQRLAAGDGIGGRIAERLTESRDGS